MHLSYSHKPRKTKNDNSTQNKVKQSKHMPVMYVPMFRSSFFPRIPFVIEIKMIACPQINVCVCACVYLFFYTNFYMLNSHLHFIAFYSRLFQFISFYIFSSVYRCCVLKQRNAQIFANFHFKFTFLHKICIPRNSVKISFYFNSNKINSTSWKRQSINKV